jgi:hypothetical protein
VRARLPGLHLGPGAENGLLEGLFLVRVDRAFYRWHPQKPFLSIRFSVLEPTESAGQAILGRLYCTSKALWRLTWFLRDFGYDVDLLERDEVDDRSLAGLRGVLRVSRIVRGRRVFQNLDAFAPAGEWSAGPPSERPEDDDREAGLAL